MFPRPKKTHSICSRPIFIFRWLSLFFADIVWFDLLLVSGLCLVQIFWRFQIQGGDEVFK